MAHWLKCLTAFNEDLDPITYVTAYKHLGLKL